MRPAETRFAVAPDGVRIAYQRFGRGEVDLVYIPGWVSHVDLLWDEPSAAAFLERLADFSRVTVIDKRGTGRSERVGRVVDLETRVDDVCAVLDAEEVGPAVVVGESSGAAMAAMLAATCPDRARALILSTASARARWAPDYPWGMRPEEFEAERAAIRSGWDSGEFVRSLVVPTIAPARAADEAFVRRLIDYYRQACSRDDAIGLGETWWDTDYRAILPSIAVPTLVISGPGSAEEGAYLASRIPGAVQRMVPFAGEELWVAGSDAVTTAICEFTAGVLDEEADFSRVLATVLFTDIVGSTAQSAELGDRRWEAIRRDHDEIVVSHLGRFRGRAIKSLGDGFLATFDGPARAVRASLALSRAVRRLGVEIRAGLHTGEVEFEADDVRGIAVAIAARVSAAAGASEVLVSQTVRDLVAGSGLAFEDAGEHELKGVPGAWRLYRASDRRSPVEAVAPSAGGA